MDNSPEQVSAQPVSQPSVESSNVSSQQQPVSPPVDKTFSQADINRIVGSEKQSAYERGKREAMAELEKQRAQSQSHSSHQSQAAPSLGGMPGLTQEDAERLFQEKFKELEQQHYARQTANQFVAKLDQGKAKYQDFDDVTKDLNLPSIPHVVQWANELDNTADVIYDLGVNPHKLTNILVLAERGQPALAMRELKRLSESIKANEVAKNAHRPNEPLSQISPSITGTDNGNFTPNDYRKMPWLRA